MGREGGGNVMREAKEKATKSIYMRLRCWGDNEPCVLGAVLMLAFRVLCGGAFVW